jgi:intein/homing endonuclease
VVQTEEDYRNLGLDVGVYFGDRKELNKTHTICTWQSLNILDKKSYDNDDVLTLAEFTDGVCALIVDECFDGDTLITTPHGKIPIKDLKAGDKIINFCEKTKQYKEDTIVKVHKNLTHSKSEKMIELEFDNGEKIQVTANHKFLTNKGWVRADDLTDDLEIIDVNTYS